MNSGKRQNSDNKRTRSISRKINRRLLRKLLSSFILMDIIIVVMAVFFWCHSAETGNGDKFSISNQRSFSSVTSLEPDEKNGSSDVSDAQDIHEAYADYLKAKDNNTSLKLSPGDRGYIRVAISGENSNLQNLDNNGITQLLQTHAGAGTMFKCNVSETDGLISTVIFTKV